MFGTFSAGGAVCSGSLGVSVLTHTSVPRPPNVETRALRPE
jgi:hypothetical protein